MKRLPFAVLAVSVALVLAGAFAFRSSVRARDEARFQNAMQSTEDRIANRIETYVAVLVATRAMVAARDNQIDAAHFREFASAMDLQRRYPGIQGIGWARRVAWSERAAFEEEVRRAGVRDFRVWPDDPREELHAIVHLEPLDVRNRAAVGYDMFTEPVRREAMMRARDTGQAAASGPVTLVQEIDEHDKQPGFLLYLPVYRGGVVPPTIEERRAALTGFVYGAFRADDFLSGIFGSETAPRVGFTVRDRAQPDKLLHRSGDERRDAVLRARSELDIAGRTWTLDFWTLAAWEHGSSRWVWPYALALGLTAAGILFIVTWYQARTAEQLRIRGQVLDSMSEGVSVSDERGTILYTNPAEDAMFGYERGELVGKHVTVQNTYPASESERIVGEVIAELRDKGMWAGEFENVKKDGTPFVTAAHITALTIGGRSYWVCVQQDVTEKKAHEKERAELLSREQSLRAQAEAASRAKDDFLAMLGHELRNPLAPIVTALALLERRAEMSAGRELTIIKRQVTHLQRLVDDLLDASAITRGKIKLLKTRLDVAAILDMAVETVRPLIVERRHSLEVRVEPGLAIDADEARMVQVVGNLLNNAAKYTDPGGHIRLEAAREDEEVVVRVRDDGRGIPPDALERLFALFEQGERTPDRSQGGLGIGLAVVRSLVQLHGGRVEGRSEGLGKGTEFTVRLPASGKGGSERPSAVVTRAEARHEGKRRVLVVDDNADAADMLATFLELAGHEAVVAHEGEAALAAASASRFDVAVLDIGLPGMDGYELARRLKSIEGAPGMLVALTGYGQESDRARAREAGFDHHLVKPVDTEQLVTLIGRRADA